jgi:hypothetical protein
MIEPKKGLARLGLDNAIRLRWVLRDIMAKRLKLSPVDPADLRTLIEMRLRADAERRSNCNALGNRRDGNRRLARLPVSCPRRVAGAVLLPAGCTAGWAEIESTDSAGAPAAH